MYEQSSKWELYYGEIDPAKRQELLKELVEAGDPLDDLRKKLYDVRHHGQSANHPVDRYLAAIFDLMDVARGSGFFMPSPAGRVRKILAGLGFAEAADLGDDGRGVLYWEIRNAMKRYLSTCTGEDYARMLMGTMKSSDAHKNTKTVEDIWTITGGVRRKAEKGLDDQGRADFDLYVKAVQDEFFVWKDGAKGWYEELERQRQG